MQEEIATVVNSENGMVEVTTRIQSTCGKCEQSNHCGTGLLARYLAPKPENLKLKSDLPLVAGQQVKIGLSEALLLKLAALIYLVPVLVLVISAATLGWFFPKLPEGALIAICFSSCAGYYLIVRNLIVSGRLSLGEPLIMQVFSFEETPIKVLSFPK